MKYEKEIDQILRDMIFEDWMSEDDYDELLKEVFELTGFSKDQLSKDIQNGIDKGHSLDFQLSLIRSFFCKDQ